MAKNDRMEFYRQGMLRAYKLAKEEGLDALEKEIRFRNISGVNAPVLAKELDRCVGELKSYILHTVSTMAIGVLYSEFGFGKTRLDRFSDAFAEATKGLEDGIVTWADICYNIEDLTGYRSNLINDLDEKTGMIREG